MIKILKYLKPGQWGLICLSFVFILAQVWLNLKMPDYMAAITRLVETPGSLMRDIWAQGAHMLACALGSLVSMVVVGFIAARVGAGLAHDLRSRQFAKVSSFSMAEINRFSTASLITRSTNDITQVQMLLIMGLQLVVSAPITAVWAVIKIAGKGLVWSLATAVAVLIMLVMIVLVMLLVVPKFRQMQRLTDDVNAVTRENLTGLRVVRAYNAEDYQEAKFDKANQALTNTQLFTSRAMAFMMPVMNLIMSGLSLAIYWIGVYLIRGSLAEDKLTVFSNMVVFSSYAMQVIMAFMMLVMLFVMAPRAAVSAKRINEVLDQTPSLMPGQQIGGLPGHRGEIEFRSVSFSYPDAADKVLDNVNFKASPGQTVAIIGSTGAGKTTLVNLIPRFFDATCGQVMIDGIDVVEYTSQALSALIGYVPQKAVMFKGSVSSNVAYGDNGHPPASSQQIESAIAIAQASQFVEAMDGQYDAEIAQGGANLSGGQKQRLSIARAVCRHPEIFIFDDSFSALDYRTDRQLRTALRRQTDGATTLIVAQRIGTIMDADQIIVLDGGQVAGIGKHSELLKSCPVYQEIAQSQLSEEELAA